MAAFFKMAAKMGKSCISEGNRARIIKQVSNPTFSGSRIMPDTKDWKHAHNVFQYGSCFPKMAVKTVKNRL